MMHSILFGDGTLSHGRFVGVDTYKDWHLVPSSRPTIASPGVATKFVSVPGRDGSLDLSEFVRSGRPAYGDRSGSFEFYVENGFDLSNNNAEFWMTIYPKIWNKLHGRKFKMVLEEDDPDYYWEGRFSVDKYEPGDGSHSVVSISYVLKPWKRRIRKISEGMVWDNFNFEADYDYDPWGLDNLEITTSKAMSIWGDGYQWQPEIIVKSGGPFTLNFGGKTATIATTGITSGEIGRASYGPNTMTLTGTGVVSIDWRGGSL